MPLINATLRGDVKAAERSIKGADIHEDDDYALRFAAANGNFEIVKLLLENGADVHAMSDYPLRWASENGHSEIVKLLLEKGANVHAVNNTPICFAVLHEHLRIVKMLLDKGADMYVCDNYPIRAACKGSQRGIIRLFLKKGIDVHFRNNYLFWLANHFEITKELTRWSFPDNEFLYSTSGLVLKESFFWNLPKQMIEEVSRCLFSLN